MKEKRSREAETTPSSSNECSAQQSFSNGSAGRRGKGRTTGRLDVDKAKKSLLGHLGIQVAHKNNGKHPETMDAARPQHSAPIKEPLEEEAPSSPKEPEVQDSSDDTGYGREEELESIAAIYCNEVTVEPPNCATLKCRKDLRITFVLPKGYPARCPPRLEISAPSLTTAEKQRISAELQRVFEEHTGEPVLYFAIDAALQMELDSPPSSVDNGQAEAVDGVEQWTEKDQKELEEAERRIRQEKTVAAENVPEIYSGSSVEDRKSVFQAHVARITSKEEAMSVLAKLKENGKIARATHNMYAWMTTMQKNGKSFELHDCEDDGENAAGAKLLNLLSLMQIQDVMVVVTRWYGGIHLGPDRFRHIASAARQALIDSGIAKSVK